MTLIFSPTQVEYLLSKTLETRNVSDFRCFPIFENLHTQNEVSWGLTLKYKIHVSFICSFYTPS
jgi:hypothetical protein